MKNRKYDKMLATALIASMAGVAFSGCSRVARMEGTKLVLFPREDPYRDTVTFRFEPGPVTFTDQRIDLTPLPTPGTFHGSDVEIDFPEQGKYKCRIEKPGFVPVEFVADGSLFRGRNEIVFRLQPIESQ